MNVYVTELEKWVESGLSTFEIRRLKYFSSFAAVKIGKKKCVQSFVCICLQMIEHTFFLPIFTAAIDEKYFSFTNFLNTLFSKMIPNFWWLGTMLIYKKQ